MKHAIAAILGIIMMVSVTIGGVAFLTNNRVEAAPVADCVVQLLGGSNNFSVTCTDALGNIIPPAKIDLSLLNGQIIVKVEGPTVTVTETVKVPGPTKTVTTPGPTKTVTTPGPTKTVRPAPITITKTVRPRPIRVTETVRVTLPSEPGPTQTVTLTPEPAPTVTETVTPEPVTVTETVTRQPEPTSGTLEPDSREPFLRRDVDFGDDSVSAGEAGIGLLSALLIIAAIVGGTAYGFRRGRASKEPEESDFLRDTLDRAKTE